MNPAVPKTRWYYVYLLRSKIKNWVYPAPARNGWIYTVGITKKGKAG